MADAQDHHAAASKALAGLWDRAADRVLARPYLDPQMAAAKREVHLDLLERWLPDLTDKIVLKTDLWEEGVGGDELLFTLARRAEAAYGIDVSPRVVSAAELAAHRAAATPRLLNADVRELPFAQGSIDAVVSTSTLDHLDETAEREAALIDIRRVLAPDGALVVTVDNAENICDWLLRAAVALRAIPFPLGPALSLADLRNLLRRAGFDPGDHAYVVHGPRVLTTALVRLMRLLPASYSDRAVARLLLAFDAAGRRAPHRTGSFIAVRATPARTADVDAGGGAEEVRE